CLLLVIFQLLLSKQKEIASRLLTIFFVCVGLNALCNLLLWNKYLHSDSTFFKWLLAVGLSLTVVGKSISLLLYVMSITRESFRFSRREALHLINVVLVFVLMTVGRIDSDQLRFISNTQTEFTISVTNFLWHYLKLLTVVYAASAVWAVWHYKQQLKAFYSSLSMEGPQWLMLLTLGFALNWAWSLVVHILGQSVGINLADNFGIFDNYITFLLVNALFIYSLLYAHQLIETKNTFKEKEPVVHADHSPDVIERVRQGMEVQQLYLKHTLNIEEFSKQVGIHFREVSVIINKHFNTNFFEFVNSYRVNKAKDMLVDPACADRTILDILLESGFNSKSSFHRFFKRYTGMSAAEYRKQHATGLASLNDVNKNKNG
ncbi:MAG: AraC family transcriptional regulator, partial [Moraxellaceae bacterium]